MLWFNKNNLKDLLKTMLWFNKSNLKDLLKTMLWFNNKINDMIQLINCRKISYSEGQTKDCLEMRDTTVFLLGKPIRNP